MHHSKPDVHPSEYFGKAIELAKSGKTVICDRHCVGERVYATVKKQDSQWTEEQYCEMLQTLSDMNAILIYAWEYTDILKKRYAEAPDDYVSAKEMMKAQRMFKREIDWIARKFPGILCLKCKPSSNYLNFIGL